MSALTSASDWHSYLPASQWLSEYKAAWVNAYWKPLDFELPKLQTGTSWRRWIDTALDSPDDIVPWHAAPAVSGDTYRAETRSVVMLFSDGSNKTVHVDEAHHEKKKVRG